MKLPEGVKAALLGPGRYELERRAEKAEAKQRELENTIQRQIKIYFADRRTIEAIREYCLERMKYEGIVEEGACRDILRLLDEPRRDEVGEVIPDD